jgi:hypothetical protein
MADFIADWTKPSSYTEGTIVYMSWQVYCDGAYGVSRDGAAVILKSPSDIRLRYVA